MSYCSAARAIIIHPTQQRIQGVTQCSALCSRTLHRCITLLEREMEKVGPTDGLSALLRVLDVAGKQVNT